jgi:uncharacterized membrane protein YheB (UPF0754 family)
MRMNIQFIRKKHEMNPRQIKRLISLEERIASGKINKEIIEQIGSLYKQFMDYCEMIREPLKLYFQEKLEYLYLNEKVAKMLLKQENRAKKEDVQVLSDSFLNFSEIQETPVPGLEEYFSGNQFIENEQRGGGVEDSLKGGIN